MDVTPDLPSRQQMGALVSRLIACNPTFAEQFPHRDAQGRRVVVPVRGSDSVHDLTLLVRQGGGTGSFVALSKHPDDGRYSFCIGTVSVSTDVVAGDHHVPITPQCTVGDLIRVLAPGATITYRLADGELSLQDFKTEQVSDPVVA